MRGGCKYFVVVLTASVLTGCSRGNDTFVRQYVDMYKPAETAPEKADFTLTDRPVPMINTNLPIGSDEESPATQPVDIVPSKAGKGEHWAKRRGPAYPGDFWRSFGRDAKELPATIWDDTNATFTDPWTLVAMGAAGAVGIALDATNVNGSVADHFTENRPQLSKFGDMVGDVGGNPGTHFGIAGAMYFTSLATGDVKTYETSKALINALAVNGLTTLALKGLARTESPNGDEFGWPSGHTSSTFCLATVMHEAYGPVVGVPLFIFSSFVGYERIDARNHDFNDVISGAIIGIAIGHAVMQNHQPRILGFDVIPWSDPTNNSVGIALSKEF
ncbi:MAG: phosphatase PAP2 family protein [Planctomycetota bacterium]|nr:phosphatase PAP2 family protein [Planctomycetota bacterium]